MLKGRGRDARAATSPAPAHLNRPLPQQPVTAARTLAAVPSSSKLTLRTPTAQRAPLAKPEPDYEVVEFPTEQYVNAKLQPPPPPPPRPPTGHPAEAASCGLCGGGGARVRCAECGRRALCASCDDMYHRHPKRRHHQRQALTVTQLRDDRPPLPPKATPPVPPPRRHKLSGSSPSPRPPSDLRSATLGPHMHVQSAMIANNPMSTLPSQHTVPPHLTKILGSMPYLPNAHQVHQPHHPAPMQQTTSMGPIASGWGRPRGSLPGFNVPQNMQMTAEPWESPEIVPPQAIGWGRPLRRGASVLELGGQAVVPGAGGCGGCAGWRYGSCASLDHPWAPAWQPPCCGHAPPPHHHAPYTPQPYRRADSRAVSRAGSRTCSRAASPAMSTRSRTSRRTKHRTPSPPPLPSSDADSESESDNDRRPDRYPEKPKVLEPSEESLGPAPAPPDAPWQCEHCTFVNEPGVRVCVVCCRTPTAAPKIVDDPRKSYEQAKTNLTPAVNNVDKRDDDNPSKGYEQAKSNLKQAVNNFELRRDAQSIADSARAVADTARSIARLDVNDNRSDASISPVPLRSNGNGAAQVQNGVATKQKTVSKKERVSTGCGPSPPREEPKRITNHLATPTREASEPPRHDMGVGPSPPKEIERMSVPSDHRPVRASPYRETIPEPPTRHSISVGPSPPRENVQRSPSVLKKSAGTSPPRDRREPRPSAGRANVSNTGTSPPPQSISTQTYEVPSTWERTPSAAAARSRRRFRDRDERRERSHSRHSLSSDTRESERSTRTGGGGGGGGDGASGRWEWRSGRDSSPGGEWSGSERRPVRLARRASHLDLRRGRAPVDRRSSFYGSEAASPEPARAMSLEALANQSAAAERGLELARLMGDAERLGFSAAEVQAALAQSPAAPLAWLRERWPSLCAGVRAAAARLEPRALVTDLEARAALARHRGAMWPAVTDCVERHRRQAAAPAAVTGRVWGSPAGAEDEAAPPRRAEGSSDEFEGPAPAELRDDDWMYLPLDANPKPLTDPFRDAWNLPLEGRVYGSAREAAHAVDLLVQAAAAPIPNDSLFETLLLTDEPPGDGYGGVKPHALDFIQSENDFIEAYNALTQSTPLPVQEQELATETGPKRDTYDVLGDDSHLFINDVIDANANNNITAEPPTNRFKEITNHNNQQQSNIEQQTGNFEVISYNVQTKQLPSTTHIEKVEKTRDLTNHITDHFNSPLAVVHRGTEGSSVDNSIVINKEITPQPQIDAPKNENAEVETIVESGSKKNVPVRQEEEKSNNLNDIVDNTQRLIQQMKEEINSDIYSIDSRNISQSEADSSSNESDISTEHESSFSESDEGETENLSSNDESSSTDSGGKPMTERRPTIIHRTSSEENDHFEEAMDHIEDQIEDFKNTNIEILDSIARSLQEEHSISVEQTEMNKPKIISSNGEDQNNNLFVEVNSFEEIYAELNTSITKDKSPTIHENMNNVNTERVNIINNEYKSEDDNFEEPMNEEENNIAKFEIVISSYHTPPSIRPLISENNQSIYNAVLDTIEEDLTITDKVLQNDSLNVASSQSETSDAEENVDDDIVNNETINISLSNSHQPSDEVTTIPIENDIQPSTEINETIADFDNKEVTEEKTAENDNHNLTDGVEYIDVDVANIGTDQEIVTEKEVVTIEEPEVQLPQISTTQSEQTATKPAKDNLTNRTLNSIKSNIPKFIKLVQNNKQKQDKSSAKVISSKVPVRRTSLKQYPAPAPPKAHFGNIQSGHVKQLQTRLFNNKFPKTAVNVPTAVEAKPSTSTTVEVKPAISTLNKKKHAPPPPSVEPNKASPITSSPPKEKKANFFRESCRTEDEWTESDSEESQIQVVRTNDEPERAPSPPPPLTLRRVSGQIIDLAKVQLPEGSPERQARMLLAQGATETWEQARLAVELAARGAAAPAALLAALECADLPAALAYLQQDCELCAARLPEHEMVSMLRCTHRCCRECARHYFTVQISERSIADCVCPYCKAPELEAMPEDEWMEYFAHLDILLKTLLDVEVHELFQRKLRDRTLARDPNFRWCVECSSGFFVHPKQKKLRCPECRSVSCAKCRKPWSANHEGLSCEQYAAWLDDNDPERSAAAVQQHLRENGLDCPRCRFKYSLSRGGCMHFTCTQCKYEFCYGCGKPFTMGARCGLSEYCAKLGLHAHHPRNCLFYLRDKEPHQLQTLLQMNNVPYELEPPEGSPSRCPIQLQRETPAGLVDGSCGGDVPPRHAGLCKNHYLEYLSRVVRARGVDPLPLLDAADLETLVRRAALRPPPRPYGSLDGLYRRALQEVSPHYVEYLAGLARSLDPIPVMDLPELVAELRRRALPLPERGPWDSDPLYAGMCAEIVKEKIPLD